MKNRKRFITIFFIVAVLVLGVGYAAIGTVTLKITGDVTATPNDENFKVTFNGTKVADNCTATATVTITLNTTPITDNIATDFTVNIKADATAAAN